MSMVARHLHGPLLLATALLLLHPATTRADVDLTGSWTVYGTYSGAPQGPFTWNITQSGTSLSVDSGGSTYTGYITPSTGSLTIYPTIFSPCPDVLQGTASADSNAFSGSIYHTVVSCSGGPSTCDCVPGQEVGAASGCRIGAGGDCCGDGVVGASEECDNGPELSTGCCDGTCHVRPAGNACTPDASPCTTDACNASGTCTHTPVAAGTACYDDLNPCTTDECDAGGMCTHPAVAAGTPCPDDGDQCTLDQCTADGTCSHPAAPDADGDGICDDADPCPHGVALGAARLKVGRFTTPGGDDRLNVRGEVTPPGSIDPVTTGVRLLLDAPGGSYLDVTVPGGAYDPGTRTGWKVMPGKFTFRSPTPVGGAVRAVQLKMSAATPGEFRVAITGRGGTFATTPLTAPVVARVMLDPPTAAQCGETTFPAAACTARSWGVLDCQ